MKSLSQAWQRVAATTLAAPIIWGTSYLTITELLPPDRPLLVAALRVTPAGLVLLGVHCWTQSPAHPDWRRITVAAFFNFALFLPLLVVAVYRLPGGVAASVGGLQPLLVIGLTASLERRLPPTTNTAAALAAAIGVTLVVVRPGASVDVIGVVAAIGANISFAAGVVTTRRWPIRSPHLQATGWQLILSGAVLTPLTLVIEGAPPTLDRTNLAGIAYLSLVGTAATFIAWFEGIRRLPTIAPPLLGLAAPLTGAALGWVVLDQALSPVQIAGFALTIAAISYGATRRPTAARGTSRQQRTKVSVEGPCQVTGPCPVGVNR